MERGLDRTQPAGAEDRRKKFYHWKKNEEGGGFSDWHEKHGITPFMYLSSATVSNKQKFDARWPESIKNKILHWWKNGSNNIFKKAYKSKLSPILW